MSSVAAEKEVGNLKGIASIESIDKSELKGKRVLVRVDYNVPVVNNKITDDERIVRSLPTLNYLIDAGAKIVLVSHMGRPKTFDPACSLKIVQEKLAGLVSTPVGFTNTSIIDSDGLTDQVNALAEGSILILENIRFYAEETKNSDSLGKALSTLCDLFVQDAFGCVHRAHASTEAITHYVPCYSGLLVQKELTVLGQLMSAPEHPFVGIIGGSKVSSKIAILDKLLDVVDTLIIGGGMSFSFLKAQGFDIGTSICEDEYIEKAGQLLELAKQKNTNIMLPLDVVAADKFSNDATIKTVDIEHIPSDMMGLDIGPKSVESLKKVLGDAKTVLWNGPLGVYEMEAFSKGTKAIAKYLSESSAYTVIGGGDVVSACKQSGYIDRMSYCSTGGGASLEFIQGNKLPGIEALRR